MTTMISHINRQSDEFKSNYQAASASVQTLQRLYAEIALGGNEKAARLSGIKTERLTFYTFINMGVLAALAGPRPS